MSLTISNLITSSKCYIYAEEILSGKITACRKVIGACRRFMDDIEKMSNPEYPWAFDITKAYRPIDFIEKFTVPTKGDYERMELMSWQHFILGNIYGWVSKKTGYRRFREAIILVGSGNGKSTLITGAALFAASKDGERGAEVYLLANSKDQAKIIFNECDAQIAASKILSKHFRRTKTAIFYDKTKSVIAPLASDSTTIDGKNVHFGVFDEEQDFKDYDLINRITPKTKKRRQPLIWHISTLGTVIDGPLMDNYELASKILVGGEALSEDVKDRLFAYIAEIDEKDDPDDRSCWIKANPALGVLLMTEDLIEEWEKSKLIPALRSNFINRQLNVFTAVDELSLLDEKTIKANNKEIDLKTLDGMVCYGGFDASTTEDFASACIVFPLGDNMFFVLSHTWAPDKKKKINHEKLDWQNLEREGLLTVCPGEYVEFSYIFEWFIEQRKKYRIDCIGYDPAKAYDLVNALNGKGFIMEAVRQGELTLTAPLDNLKERFLDQKIIHNNNRLYNWYLGNVKLTKRSANGTYLPTKQNKNRKIDGFAAHLDAHVVYMRKNQIAIPPDKKIATVISLA